MPTGFGETLRAVQVATVLTTDPGIKALEARRYVLDSDAVKPDDLGKISEKLKKALEKKDIKTILILLN